MTRLTAYLALIAATLKDRLHQARQEPERGDVPDNIVVISLLVLLAIAAVAIITAKVLARANSINM
jgi:hypothetical protein